MSVRSKVGLGLQARLPRVQLGHIEHMLMSWRGLWDCSGRGGGVEFNKEEASQRGRAKPRSQGNLVSLVGGAWQPGLGCGWCFGMLGKDGEDCWEDREHQGGNSSGFLEDNGKSSVSTAELKAINAAGWRERSPRFF